ncbi:glutamate-5-semialdehyde dehydrogenase [Ruminococcaceae bacterium OttesenSCG-928-L11]|nr:glutamate-5-semialdehyde dehydrogenase [Ruminococcaceae bacterium OttesenSCG-928-L11]
MLNNSLMGLGVRARKSATELAIALSGVKNDALEAIASAVAFHMEQILAANAKDMAAAKESGMSDAMQDRLLLTEDRLRDIAEAVRYVKGLEEPVGRVVGGDIRPNGLQIVKRTVPLGVVGMIYESRPNVTVDCAALCLKSGNACILRGGKEAIHSNMALVSVMREAVESVGLSADCIQLVEDTSRETATELMRLNGYVDVLIPRGGAGLIASVVKNATVPVIETGAGNCHIFVDATADLEMAARVLNNAKTSRPSVCNAVETLLVHRDCGAKFLPMAADALAHAGVELRGCEQTVAILGERAKPATEEDWATEYDDYILAIRVVEDMEEAIAHIEAYSTRHSETIMTQSHDNARLFCDRVDSAAVYVNASTRFTDGGEFGLGAEIGISTQKLHARGPMGLAHLTSYKYIINGSGQIR